MIRKFLLGVLTLGLLTTAWAGDLPMPGFATIPQILKAVPGSTYTTQGYVVFKYTCPPCPDGALCKPCMEANVIISETNTVLENYTRLSDSELVVYTDKVDELELGKKYYLIVSTQPIEADPRPMRAEANEWWKEGENPPPIDRRASRIDGGRDLRI